MTDSRIAALRTTMEAENDDLERSISREELLQQTMRRFIGDMSKTEQILFRLDVKLHG